MNLIHVSSGLSKIGCLAGQMYFVSSLRFDNYLKKFKINLNFHPEICRWNLPLANNMDSMENSPPFFLASRNGLFSAPIELWSLTVSILHYYHLKRIEINDVRDGNHWTSRPLGASQAQPFVHWALGALSANLQESSTLPIWGVNNDHLMIIINIK